MACMHVCASQAPAGRSRFAWFLVCFALGPWLGPCIYIWLLHGPWLLVLDSFMVPVHARLFQCNTGSVRRIRFLCVGRKVGLGSERSSICACQREFGNLDIWESGNVRMWEHGNQEFGNSGTWKLGIRRNQRKKKLLQMIIPAATKSARARLAIIKELQ